LSKVWYNSGIPNFTSYFIAIPLPQAFLPEFARFLTKVTSISSNIESAHPDTPHITLCYLKSSADSHLEEISQIAHDLAITLKDEQLTIRGLRVFTPESPRILYLGVSASSKVTQLNTSLAENLAEYASEDNELDFVPHLTLARLPFDDTVSPFARTLSRMKILADTITWNFPITELAIYGADSSQTPEFQEKLHTIEL
jgi:2'-5' RNA ligase